MTRKDYELIARAISNSRVLAESDAEQTAIDNVAKMIAFEIRNCDNNPRFDTAKFLEATEFKPFV